ncbi:MAG: hypothetical protein K2M79_02985 [Muribaculaceae bacterium]|nr:hypothetical protein [Muribaculaceae bacterium]
MKKNIIWILSTILLAAAVVCGIWFYSRNQRQQDPRRYLLSFVPDKTPFIAVINGNDLLKNAGYTDYQPGIPVDLPIPLSSLKTMIGSSDAEFLNSLAAAEGINLNAMVLATWYREDDWLHPLLMASVTDHDKLTASLNGIDELEATSGSQGKIWSVNGNYIFYIPDNEDVLFMTEAMWVEKSNGDYSWEDPEDAVASMVKFIKSSESSHLASWKTDYLVRPELSASALLDKKNLESGMRPKDAEYFKQYLDLMDASWQYLGLQANLDNQTLKAVVNALDAQGRFTDLTNMEVSCKRTPTPTDNSVGLFLPVRQFCSSEDFRYEFAHFLGDMLYSGSERNDYWSSNYSSDTTAVNQSPRFTEDQVFIYRSLKDNLMNLNSFAWRMNFYDSSFDVQEQLQFTYERDALNFYNTLYNNPVPYFRKDFSGLKIYNPEIYGNKVDLTMTQNDTYVWFGQPMEDHLQLHPLAFAFANLSRSDLSALAQGFSPKFGIKASCDVTQRAAVLKLTLTETDKTLLENIFDTLKLMSSIL